MGRASHLLLDYGAATEGQTQRPHPSRLPVSLKMAANRPTENTLTNESFTQKGEPA
jgi:hypothetical protein